MSKFIENAVVALSQKIPMGRASFGVCIIVAFCVSIATSSCIAQDAINNLIPKSSEKQFFKSAGKLKYFYSGRMYFLHRPQSLAVLPDGKIALFGGYSWDQTRPISTVGIEGRPSLRKAELYDPQTEKSVALPDSPYDLADNMPRAITLKDGNILIAGNYIGRTILKGTGAATCECAKMESKEKQIVCEKTTALLFDSKSQSYQSLFNFRPACMGSTMTLRSDGNVLLLGGMPNAKENTLLEKESKFQRNVTNQNDASHKLLSTPATWKVIRLFDAQKDKTSDAGLLPMTIYGHATVPIDDNRILLIGGIANPRRKNIPKEAYLTEYIKDIQLYDLNTKTFKTVGQLNYPRQLHIVVPLGQSKFLIVSGENKSVRDPVSQRDRVDELEVFNLKTGQCKVVGSFSGETLVTPAKLPDGRILLIGGIKIGVFDPNNDQVKEIGTLIEKRTGFFVATTLDGQIYVFGGTNNKTEQLVERFDYAALKRWEKSK